MKKGLFVICMAALFATSCTQTGKTEEDRFIEDLLSQMTLEEKIGQMNQIHFDKSLDSIKAHVRNGELGLIVQHRPETNQRNTKNCRRRVTAGYPPHHRAGYCPRLQNGTAHSGWAMGSPVRPGQLVKKDHTVDTDGRDKHYMDLRSHARHLSRRPLGTYCRGVWRRLYLGCQ